MSDNGQEWVWMIGYLHGYGHVCFQRAFGSRPGEGFTTIRRITNIKAEDTQPGKVEYNFDPHLFHATGIFPDEMKMRPEAIVVFAEAPQKVVDVLEDTWEPAQIKAATPGELHRLGDIT